MSKKRTITVGLLFLAALIAFLPLIIVKDSEFGGADDAASEMIAEMNEGFQPWFRPVWEPPGGEMESLLFALQAALGSGVLFYCIGYWKGKNENKNDYHR